MGIGVSGWRLARAVSAAGQLGVVSLTAVDSLMVRRLQDGDAGGHLRRAMSRFPLPQIADGVLQRYFLPEGRPEGQPYKLLTMFSRTSGKRRQEVTMLAGFVEVELAREGHHGMVGANLLTKLQLPNLPLLYGAMLAGVDVILMGAGIPREIPGVLDALAAHRPVELRMDIEDDSAGGSEVISFDPRQHWPEGQLPAPLTRPRFLAIIASNSLATVLARKASGRVDGFVVEGSTAGGHNAPPRGAASFNEKGEPVYGERDAVDLSRLRELGIPFWLAGGVGSPESLVQAEAAGAAGIQVGTLFAYCDESGLSPEIKRSVLAAVSEGTVEVFTDPLASPTGYPFKVVRWPGDPTGGQAEPRHRICDLGYLRSAYRREDGGIGYRCPAEPVADFVRKGGAESETVGRRCLCNGLMADVGFGQSRGDGRVEPPLVTSGDDLASLGRFLGGRSGYPARNVVEYLLGREAPLPQSTGR
ncbi:MAG: nitronate monooxygenase [Gemmatimonadota bacterium]